tara:strand:- start:3393 stop:4178 length:786 start_codon:yes stop_codon:yes gene_type:complete
MKNKNEKGFALVLSLTLLLVMSLLGGSLIVITSGDHQSNNTSDEYQQAFYVAETALLQAEKNLINKMMGPWVDPTGEGALPPADDATEEERTSHTKYVQQLIDSSILSGDSKFARNTDKRATPRNLEDGFSGIDRSTECYKSFRNILRRDTALVVEHVTNQSFAQLIFPLLEKSNYSTIDSLATDKEMEKETIRMSDYRYEFFSVNIGTSTFAGTGSSLKKSSTNTQRSGTSYKIYGCGYLERGGEIDVLIPLETIVVLSS